jgi:arylsulfatase A-like enzyme
MEPSTLARIRSDYLGRVSMIDYGLGRLMAEVENRADRGRTWFVVASDRGQMLGEQGIVGHRAFLAGAIEVPVLIAPGDPALHRKATDDTMHLVDGQYNTVDVAATIAALTGSDLPEACVGRSLLPTLSGNSALPVPAGGNLSEFGHRLMLETERYKVIFDVQAHRALGLFDLLNDPDEMENLVETAVGRNLVDAMRWRIGEALMAVRSHPYM